MKSRVTGRVTYRRISSTPNPIRKWNEDFSQKGCNWDQRKVHSGWPAVSEEVTNWVRTLFVRCSKKSIRGTCWESHLPKSTACKIFHKNLQFHPYKKQLVTKFHLQDNSMLFWIFWAHRAIKRREQSAVKIIFSDKAIFPLNSKVNSHNVPILEQKFQHAT